MSRSLGDGKSDLNPPRAAENLPPLKEGVPQETVASIEKLAGITSSLAARLEAVNSALERCRGGWEGGRR